MRYERNMKIIFMGTPDFAVPGLELLLSSEHQVVAVYTQAPKPKGRGMKIAQSPVQIVAKARGIPVYTPSSLKLPEVQEQIDNIEADIIVVVAYGFIVPKRILQSKHYGCLNIHPSKLPRFRGAAPLQRTIIAGDCETAVCIMQMDEGLDTGDILMREDFAISSSITIQELHDICAEKGAELLLKTIDNIDNLPPLKQGSEGATYAPKLKKEEGKIDWSESALDIERKIRGMTPWPGVFFEYKGELVKILKAQVQEKDYTETPGTIIEKDLVIVCSSKALLIDIVQKAGKGPISFKELLDNFCISVRFLDVI